MQGLCSPGISMHLQKMSILMFFRGGLTTHILSLIASGFVCSRPALREFMRTTFYFHQKKQDRILESVIGRALSFLDGAEMIVQQDDLLSATEYGIDRLPSGH